MAKTVEEWGKDAARSRYGSPTGSIAAPKDQCYPQKLGDADNLQGPKYQNDTPNNWLRGNGNKPGFDRAKGKR